MGVSFLVQIRNSNNENPECTSGANKSWNTGKERENSAIKSEFGPVSRNPFAAYERGENWDESSELNTWIEKKTDSAETQLELGTWLELG